jgi:hypothetical protein
MGGRDWRGGTGRAGQTERYGIRTKKRIENKEEEKKGRKEEKEQ